MSTEPRNDRETLLSDLMRELRLMSSFDALYSHAVAERVGVHATDIETMDLLNTLGTMTAGELSEHTGLTSGATTRLIDRLVRKGFVRRKTDESDRRRVLIEPIHVNHAELGQLYAPFHDAIVDVVSSYSDEQLALIIEFVRDSNARVAKLNATLRAGDGDEAP